LYDTYREGIYVTASGASFVLILQATSYSANFKHDFPSFSRDPPLTPDENPLNKSGFYFTVFMESIEERDFL
jgi:hypothetical protein